MPFDPTKPFDPLSPDVVRRAAESAGIIAPLPKPGEPAVPITTVHTSGTAPTKDAIEAKWKEALGPTYVGLTDPRSIALGFDDATRAAAAVSMLPAAMIATAARPYVQRAYAFVDWIPEALRRPFEKNLGLLIDTALANAATLTEPLANAAIDAVRGGAPLPAAASVPARAYSQIENSCGETAAATILKALGDPVALGDLDTQVSVYDGTNYALDREIARRGLALITGEGDMERVKAFVAAGYPVLVSVGWKRGGGHYAVISGYDDAAGVFEIKSYDGQGGNNRVLYSKFAADWERHQRYMAIVLPARDRRLDGLIRAGEARRPDRIYSGFSLSDFWVTAAGHIFVEAAYRFVSSTTDVTVRVNYSSQPVELQRRIGGSIALAKQLAPGWHVGVKVEKISLLGRGNEWQSFATLPLAVSATLGAPGFTLRASAERGGLQAAIGWDLGRFLEGLGAEASISADVDGNYRIMGTITGTF